MLTKIGKRKKKEEIIAGNFYHKIKYPFSTLLPSATLDIKSRFESKPGCHSPLTLI